MPKKNQPIKRHSKYPYDEDQYQLMKELREEENITEAAQERIAAAEYAEKRGKVWPGRRH